MEKIFVQGGDPVLVFLLGDPAYSVLPFSMEECFGGGRNERKSFFSHKVSRARIPIENTFLS